VVLPAEAVSELLAQHEARPGATVAVDLPGQTVAFPDGAVHGFDIDPFDKRCLLEELDELGYTLSLADEIAAFERRMGRENAL
jgi:3-isopropylmalate/(R)-2-methylmalate dehydratase small subunit